MKQEFANPPSGDPWWSEDPDLDTLLNSAEVTFGSDPYSGDADFDGLPDGTEQTAGTNPWLPDSSSPLNGLGDWLEYHHGWDAPLLSSTLVQQCQPKLMEVRRLLAQCAVIRASQGLGGAWVVKWTELLARYREYELLVAQIRTAFPSSTLADDLTSLVIEAKFMADPPPAPQESFSSWQAYSSPASTAPSQNWDSDFMDDALEYALGTPRASGRTVGLELSAPVGLHLVPSGSSVTGYVFRPSSRSEGTLEVETSSDMIAWTATAPSYVAAPSAAYGEIQRVAVWSALDSGAASGFARIKFTLPGGHVSRSQPVAWSAVSVVSGGSLQTYGPTLLGESFFVGSISAVNGQAISLSVLETGDLTASFIPGRQVYMEIAEGPAAGHRFEVDEAACSATAISLNLADPLSTASSLPSGLPGARFVLRHHLTLDDLFPKASFTGTNNPATADKVMRWVNGAWQSLWLLDLRTAEDPGAAWHWAQEGDATLANRGSTLVPPGTGFMVKRLSSPALTLFDLGEVRGWPARRKIVTGAAMNFLTGTLPFTQSPNALGLTPAAGFKATTSPATADRFQLWNGDSTPASQSWLTHWLYGSATIPGGWVRQGDGTLAIQSDSQLFQRGRAHFLRAATVTGFTSDLPAGVSLSTPVNPFFDGNGDGRADHDGDSDGLPDVWEMLHFGSLANDGSGDSDSDGLTNIQELNVGTNPALADTDGDTLSDGAEVNTHSQHGLSPLTAYSKTIEYNDAIWLAMRDGDNDGIVAAAEQAYGLSDSNPNDAWTDPDGDGLANFIEIQRGLNPNQPSGTLDTDGDGMSNEFEMQFHQNTGNFYDSMVDSDGDGLLNFEEALYSLNPLNPRTRGGSTKDFEVVFGTISGGGGSGSASAPTGGGAIAPQAQGTVAAPVSSFDWDGDGLPNWWEALYRTLMRTPDANGLLSDPDSDGLSNAQEFLALSDPLDSDTDDDGIPDGTDPYPGSVAVPPGDSGYRQIVHFTSQYMRHLASRGILMERIDSEAGAVGEMLVDTRTPSGYELRVLPSLRIAPSFAPWGGKFGYYGNLVSAAAGLLEYGNARWALASTKYQYASWLVNTDGETSQRMATTGFSYVDGTATYYPSGTWSTPRYSRTDMRYFYVSDEAAQEAGDVYLRVRKYRHPANVPWTNREDMAEHLYADELVRLPVGTSREAPALWNPTPTLSDSATGSYGDTFAGDMRVHPGDTVSAHASALLHDLDLLRPDGDVEVEEHEELTPGYIVPLLPTPEQMPKLKIHPSGDGGFFTVQASPALITFLGDSTDLDGTQAHEIPMIAAGGVWQRVTIKLLYSLTGEINTYQQVDEVALLPVEVKLDVNRDGAFDGADATSQAKPLRFWLNSDTDIQEDTENPPSGADSQDGIISSTRDLEDFIMMKFEIPIELQGKIRTGEYQIGLKWTQSSGAPSIRVYRAHNETTVIPSQYSYLWDQTNAAALARGYQNMSLGTIGAATEWIPSSALFPVTYQGNLFHPYLIFEGVNEGKGKLTLMLKIGGNDIEAPGAWIDLLNIKKMYQRSNGADFVAPAAGDEEEETVVFVHGWRMSPEGSDQYAETIFKRLWQRGFKGRFASFRWNTYYFDWFDHMGDLSTALNAYFSKFNDSEHNAWYEAGAALKTFTEGLPYPNARCVVAHSLGNAVVASALGQGMDVRRHVLLHGAVPACCYDENPSLKEASRTHSTSLGTYNCWSGNGALSPDDDSDSATRDLAYRGRLKTSAAHLVNFFLPDDEATSIAWEINNLVTKPPGGLAPGPARPFYYDRSAAPGKKLWKDKIGVDANGEPVLMFDYYLTDPYEAMPYACRSWSKAVGAQGNTAGSIADKLDMGAMFGFGVNHNAEFQWRIQKLKDFIDQLSIKLELEVPNP